MAFARINDNVLHYEFLTESKKHPVVVFINPLGADFRIWLPLLDELTEEWSLLLYDKRGHGLSDIGETPYSIGDHASDLIGLMDHLGIRKAHFVGLSVGGLIVQEIYKKRPQLVRKIVLSNTAHKIGTAEIWNERIDGIANSGLAALADNVLLRWFTPDFHRNRPEDLIGYRNMLVRQSAEGYAATCAAIRDADFTEDAHRMSVPVLCLAGDKDGSTPPDIVKATASLIPGSGFQIIEKCGHIPCVEQPELMADILAEFFEDS